MIFDRADAADIPQLVELRLSYLAEDVGVSPKDEAEIRMRLPDYLRRKLNRELTAFVARDGDEIVACALLLSVEKPMSPAFLNGQTATVLNVYTKPSHRRRGYARRLMEMLMAEAAEGQISRVELKATGMGYGLYRSLGFVEDGSEYRLMRWKPLCR